MKQTKTETTSPVPVWRDLARRICESCGWGWGAVEYNEQEAPARRLPVAGYADSVFWALRQGRDAPPAVLEEAARKLEDRLTPLAEELRRSGDADTENRAGGWIMQECGLFLSTLSRLMERPADTPAAPVAAVETSAEKPSKGGRPRNRQDRDGVGVTQGLAAARVGRSIDTIRRWDRGQGAPQGYPGRADAVKFEQWASGWEEAKVARKAMHNAKSYNPESLRDNPQDEW